MVLGQEWLQKQAEQYSAEEEKKVVRDLQQLQRVKSRTTFEHLRTKGKSYRGQDLSIVYLPRETEIQIAFAITKKFGNAVKRNKARRRLHEAFKCISQEIRIENGAYLITARKNVNTIEFTELKNQLETICTDIESDKTD